MSIRFPSLKEAWNYRSEPERARTLADFFWKILLAAILLALLCSIWLAGWELNRILAAEAPAGAGAPGTPILTRAQLQSGLDAFSARQSAFESLSKSPAQSLADPAE